MRYSLMRQKQYPRYHTFDHKINVRVDSAHWAAFHLPVIVSDQSLGTPSTVRTHPEHASNDVATDARCFVDSKVARVQVNVWASLLKNAWDTCKMRNLIVAAMPISCSFDDLATIDEESGTTLGAVLGLTTDSTNKRTTPTYNSNIMLGDSKTFASMPGSDTTADSNGDATGFGKYTSFLPTQLYYALQSYSSRKKLMALIGQIRYRRLNVDRPSASMSFRIPPRAKRMNDYTYFGILCWIPTLGTPIQFGQKADKPNNNTNADVVFNALVNYYEWNDHFNHLEV